MPNQSTVYFGSLPDKSSTDDTQQTLTLVHFLYEKHQEFELETKTTETYLLPQDELILANLLIRDSSSKNEFMQYSNLLELWVKTSKYRLHRYAPLLNEQEHDFSSKVDDYLESNHIVDRILIAQRLLKESNDNMELKSQLMDTHYVVQSQALDWFELIILRMLTSYGMPHMTFLFGDNTKPQFFNCNQCYLNPDVCYKQYPALELFLSYLGLSVNIKDSLRLLRIFNQPYRGLDHAAFTAIRRLSKEENLSAAQVVISFVGRLRLGGSGYAPAPNHPLRQWSAGLTHLVEFLTACQDALSGADDDSRLASGSSGSMTVDGALQAVRQCLRTCYRCYRKPCPIIGSDQTKAASNLKMDELKCVLDKLTERIRSLCESIRIQNLCSDTPGRAPLEGGSLCGRAARKLVRLLLVVESERLRLYPTKSKVLKPKSLSINSPRQSEDVRTPLRELHSPRTPTTTGRNFKLLKMFDSPDTPINTHPTNQPTIDLTSKDIASDSPDPIAPTRDKFDQLSSQRSGFARFQSGLDWADMNKSPLVSKRTHSYLNNLSQEPDWDTCTSLPAWSTYDSDAVRMHLPEHSDLTVQTSSHKSVCNTPTKPSTVPVKKSKMLFTDPSPKLSHPSSMESLTADQESQIAHSAPTKSTKKLSTTAKLSTSRKCGKKIILSNNQKSIRDFFS